MSWSSGHISSRSWSCRQIWFCSSNCDLNVLGVFWKQSTSFCPCFILDLMTFVLQLYRRAAGRQFTAKVYTSHNFYHSMIWRTLLLAALFIPSKLFMNYVWVWCMNDARQWRVLFYHLEKHFYLEIPSGGKNAKNNPQKQIITKQIKLTISRWITIY